MFRQYIYTCGHFARLREDYSKSSDFYFIFHIFLYFFFSQRIKRHKLTIRQKIKMVQERKSLYCLNPIYLNDKNVFFFIFDADREMVGLVLYTHKSDLFFSHLSALCIKITRFCVGADILGIVIYLPPI